MYPSLFYTQNKAINTNKLFNTLSIPNFRTFLFFGYVYNITVLDKKNESGKKVICYLYKYVSALLFPIHISKLLLCT
jgi:hypothetical protein